MIISLPVIKEQNGRVIIDVPDGSPHRLVDRLHTEVVVVHLAWSPALSVARHRPVQVTHLLLQLRTVEVGVGEADHDDTATQVVTEVDSLRHFPPDDSQEDGSPRQPHTGAEVAENFVQLAALFWLPINFLLRLQPGQNSGGGEVAEHQPLVVVGGEEDHESPRHDVDQVDQNSAQLCEGLRLLSALKGEVQPGPCGAGAEDPGQDVVSGDHVVTGEVSHAAWLRPRRHVELVPELGERLHGAARHHHAVGRGHDLSELVGRVQQQEPQPSVHQPGGRAHHQPRLAVVHAEAGEEVHHRLEAVPGRRVLVTHHGLSGGAAAGAGGLLLVDALQELANSRPHLLVIAGLTWFVFLSKTVQFVTNLADVAVLDQLEQVQVVDLSLGQEHGGLHQLGLLSGPGLHHFLGILAWDSTEQSDKTGEDEEDLLDVEKILGLQSGAVPQFVLLELAVSRAQLAAGQGDAVDVGDGVQQVVGLVNDDDTVLQVQT